MYNLEYLPAALRDVVAISRYISRELNNPTAAASLAEKIVKAGESLTAFPYSNPAYMPIRPLKHEYRKLTVENYLMFYWVDEEKKTVNIARVIYGKRNYHRILE